VISDGPYMLDPAWSSPHGCHPCGEDSNSMLFFFGCARGPLRCVVMCNSFLSHDGMFVAPVERALTIFFSFMFLLVRVPHEFLRPKLDAAISIPLPTPHRTLLCSCCSSRFPRKPNPSPLMSYSIIKHSHLTLPIVFTPSPRALDNYTLLM